MAVKIKLTRLGKIRNPQYRVIIADARTRREGRAIETIGRYHPKEEPSLIEINSDRAQYWLGVGAQPTDPVLNLLKITGDWQKFKGLPGQEGTLRKAEPKPSKLEIFNQALAEVENGALPEATTPKTKRSKKAAAVEEAVVAETPAESEVVVEAEAEVVAEAEEIIAETPVESTEETAAEGE